MNQWIVSAAISFILRQVAKYGDATNWDTVKADLDARIRALIPGSFLDDAACELANAAVDCCAEALKDSTDLKAVADAAVAGDWAGALAALQVLLAKVVHPKGALIAGYANSMVV